MLWRTLSKMQAKVDILIQMGAFCKDFDINNLADSFIKSMLISKVSEAIENKRVENASKEKEKRVNMLKAWEALFEKTPKSN